jgi:hypothetical protein
VAKRRAHEQHHHDYAPKSFTSSISTDERRTVNAVIQATWGRTFNPLSVHMNSMVIRGREPSVVDTGCPIHHDQHLDDLFAIVEADDVHRVFISHDDVDHDGNLHQVIDACRTPPLSPAGSCANGRSSNGSRCHRCGGVGSVTASP